MEEPILDRPRASQQLEAVGARRMRVAAAWAQTGAQTAVVASGTPVPIEGTDGFHPFHAHDAFRHLSGASTPACVLVCESESSTWTLFVPALDPADAVWHGPRATLDDWSEQTGIANVRERSELGSFLEKRQSVALVGSCDLLERPGLYDIHPDRIETIGWDAEVSARCEAAHHAERRVKDAVEVHWMRAAADATVNGHEAGICGARPGKTERELAIEIESAMRMAGADGMAYQTIVLGGARASVLHGMPSSYAFERHDLVLVDAGAEVAGYDSDITRTYPTGKNFSNSASAIYRIVLAAQEEAIQGCVPGAEFLDLHRQAMHTIAEGLIDLGVLRGAPNDLIEQDAVALFFPHGLGHLLGLATHDVGGYLPGREPIDRPGLRYLRAHLPLAAGYVVTIEPGIYFNDALLSDAETRRRLASSVNWERVDALRPVGGVRIEDDVLVTAAGPDVLTAALPKTVEALEALRA